MPCFPKHALSVKLLILTEALKKLVYNLKSEVSVYSVKNIVGSNYLNHKLYVSTS